MDDSEGTYAPESPDLSAYHTGPPLTSDSAPYLQQHVNPYFQPPPQDQPSFMQYGPPQFDQFGNYLQIPPHVTQAQLDQQLHSSQHSVPIPPVDGPPSKPSRRAAKQEAAPSAAPAPRPPHNRPELDMEIKTKFPVARIKRIMQADEDVGKVAQVTPVAVSKALELFMISLVTAAAEEAKSNSSKRVTAVHLKRIVEKDQQLDFLWDIMSKVQDAPAPSDKNDAGEEGSEGKKRKGVGKKRRKDSEGF